MVEEPKFQAGRHVHAYGVDIEPHSRGAERLARAHVAPQRVAALVKRGAPAVQIFRPDCRRGAEGRACR